MLDWYHGNPLHHGNVTGDLKRRWLNTYVKGVVKHYRGKFPAYEIRNEAYKDPADEQYVQQHYESVRDTARVIHKTDPKAVVKARTLRPKVRRRSGSVTGRRTRLGCRRPMPMSTGLSTNGPKEQTINRFWIDGKVVAEHVAFRGAKADQEKHPVRLTKGKHRILVKVHNDLGGHGIYLRLLDRDGKPITRYTVKLIP